MERVRWPSVLLPLALCLLGVAGSQPADAQVYWIVAPEFAPPATGSNPEFGDLDGDLDQDLIYAVVLQSYRNVGTPYVPSWQQDNSLVEGVQYLVCMTVSLADLDADGDLDLSAGLLNGEAYPLWYWENVGTAAAPAWQMQNGMYGDLAPGCWTCPDLGDLDGDGDLDLMLAEQGGRRGYRNTGTHELASWKRDDALVGGISVPYWYFDPTLGDLDGDGDLDLVISGRTGESPIVCYENAGTPQVPVWLENEALLDGVDRDVGSFGVGLADLDGDGDLDMLSWQNPGGTVVYLNCGPTTLVEQASTWGRIKGLFREQ